MPPLRGSEGRCHLEQASHCAVPQRIIHPTQSRRTAPGNNQYFISRTHIVCSVDRSLFRGGHSEPGGCRHGAPSKGIDAGRYDLCLVIGPLSKEQPPVHLCACVQSIFASFRPRPPRSTATSSAWYAFELAGPAREGSKQRPAAVDIRQASPELSDDSNDPCPAELREVFQSASIIIQLTISLIFSLSTSPLFISPPPSLYPSLSLFLSPPTALDGKCERWIVTISVPARGSAKIATTTSSVLHLGASPP